jgi:23S rRNA (cytidine1920-2'-O)/16S rRNA (cytidine1409-2'-O)-methyltransferase
MGQKKRLDVLLVEKGLVESRHKAQGVILSGIVYVDNQKSDKVGTGVNEDASIEIRGNALPYVSRGGLKLEKAVKEFKISLNEKICIDIGASTGGFTDCMLQNGANKVFSIDVGYGQLDWKLRQDERVVNMERTNIRHVELTHIGEQVDFISIDVAFISLRLVLPVAEKLLKDDGSIICLIKPQFEAGRDKVGKKGVVRDIEVHLDVVNRIVDFSKTINLTPLCISYSPIKGPEGNIEYLLYLKKRRPENDLEAVDNEFRGINEDEIQIIVKKSHSELINHS